MNRNCSSSQLCIVTKPVFLALCYDPMLCYATHKIAQKAIPNISHTRRVSSQSLPQSIPSQTSISNPNPPHVYISQHKPILLAIIHESVPVHSFLIYKFRSCSGSPFHSNLRSYHSIPLRSSSYQMCFLGKFAHHHSFHPRR
jgi:hypothetical protein